MIEVAELFETRVVLLRVLEPRKSAEESEAERTQAEKQLAALARTIEKKGVETLRMVEAGEPVDQILKVVRAHEIDLIAMSTHGRSGLGRVVMGSVTEKVLRQATVPLLVTRTAQKKGKKESVRASRTVKK